MRVGIVGSSGYIARYLRERLSHTDGVEAIVGYDKNCVGDTVFIDLKDPASIDAGMFADVDLLIFTAAISNPDACAAQFDECWAVNVTGTERVIALALATGIKVLFFSSDAVFGSDRGVFDERSETKACTPYGRMKKAIEDRFRGQPGFKAIRLSYVASRSDRFTTYCLDCMKNGKEAEVFHPFYRNCITVTEVTDTVAWLCGHWDALPDDVLNIAGLELVSRVRMADEINRCLNNRLSYRVVTPQPAFFENRPRITQMRSLYLFELGIDTAESFTIKYQKELEAIAQL